MERIGVIFLQFAIGLLLGCGLIVAGMSNPAKVLAFLDLTRIARGAWDPSLALVMGGALTVASLGFFLTFRRPRPLFDVAFHLPAQVAIDARLLAGAAIFGVGWGIAGLCPGPAFVLLGEGAAAGLIFVVAMAIAMAAARALISKAIPASGAGRM